MNDDDRPFWSTLTSALASRDVQQAVYEQFRRDIAIRMKCKVEDVLNQPSVPLVMLLRDFEDYEITPHPDGHPRVVTMMFYLADENSPEDLGTSLYEERSALMRLRGKRFKEFKRFPFRPNSAAAFSVNDTNQRLSWHGRELITGKTVVRNTLLLQWLYKERE